MAALVVLLAASNVFAASAEARRPNVLLLFADDQRHDTIHALGNDAIITPNLDRLAKCSFVFDQAYSFGGNAGAVCIPSRNMLMTGQTYFRFGGKARSDGQGLTFPKVMRAAGYETWYREKSGKANLPHIQTQFDHFKDIHMVNALKTGYAARGIVNDAIEFLENERNAEKPFFMYQGLPCPHDPRFSAKEFRDQYDLEKIPLPENYQPQHEYDIGSMTIRDECLEVWPRTRAAIRRHVFDYYSLITGMDFDIGRLLDTLDKLGLTEDTLIIYSSDQGIALGSHGLMGKQNLYESTQKVPMLISGPGVPKGRSNALAYVHDLLPTVAELVGAGEISAKVDGESLAPIIRGKQPRVREHAMLAYTNTQRSIRNERWKLMCFPQINKTLLFDLHADPYEMENLADRPDQQERVAEMMSLLKAEQKVLGDTLPLVSEEPKPAQFHPPTRDLRSARSAGGLAPGLVNEPEAQRSRPGDATAFIGVWEYTAKQATCTREFTADGKCILKNTGVLQWEKPFVIKDDNTAIVGGRLKHVLISDSQMRIQDTFTATKKESAE